MPTIIADLHRIRSGLRCFPRPGLRRILELPVHDAGTPPNKLERSAMEVLMVLHADHELNASTFAARVITSTLADMHGALTGASPPEGSPPRRREPTCDGNDPGHP